MRCAPVSAIHLIRKAEPQDAESIARVHVASWRTTYSGIIDNAWLDDMERQLDNRIASLVRQLQRDDIQTLVTTSPKGHITGFIHIGAIRTYDPQFDGELYALYLMKGWQGMGAGRELVRAGARWLMQQGYRTMKVWVLRDNPSRLFYQHLGGQHVASQNITIGGHVLEEESYGWDRWDRLL